MSDEPLLVLYAVRNRDGKYFHAKGYGHCGATWVDDIKKARIYPRPGPARSRVTFFVTNYPSFGMPELVELHVTRVVALDEASRVQKSLQKMRTAEARREARQAKYDLERAERKMAEAQAEIDRLRKAK